MNSPTSNGLERQTDFDIHGIAGVRLVDASPGDVRAVSQKLGPLQKTLFRDPDITIRFVEHLPAPRFRQLGSDQKGFSDDAFFVRQEGNGKFKVKIPFDRIGRPFEIVCESGVRSVPLLVPILSMTVLNKGYVPLHASACVQNGVGILMAGWAHCGKTTALLGFASTGAEYIGEDWVLLSGDGKSMHGLPAEIELSAWHLDSLPHLRREVSRTRRAALRVIDLLKRRLKNSSRGKLGGSAVFRALHKVLTGLEENLRPAVMPSAVFGDRAATCTARPDKIFLLASHDSPDINVERTDPAEMARRLALSAQHELLPLLEHYLAYRFAFPGTRNGLIESAAELQFEILSRALAGKETYTILHPYPLVFDGLYEKILPLLEAKSTARAEALHAVV
jgi:hypothetical protein